MAAAVEYRTRGAEKIRLRIARVIIIIPKASVEISSPPQSSYSPRGIDLPQLLDLDALEGRQTIPVELDLQEEQGTFNEGRVSSRCYTSSGNAIR